jgi:hypothetical protein
VRNLSFVKDVGLLPLDSLCSELDGECTSGGLLALFFGMLSKLNKVQYAIRDATARFIGLGIQLPIRMTVEGSMCNSEEAANNHKFA